MNLRSVTPDPIIKISKIKSIDIIEINAHCRQKEIIELGCGQALLYDLDFLEEYVTEVVKKHINLFLLNLELMFQGSMKER